MDTEAPHPQRGRSTPDEGEERPRSAFSPTWRRAGLLGAACAVFLLVFSNFVLQPFLIPSRSMEPVFEIGDRVLVNKLAYRFGDRPRRGDLVVFDGAGSFVREYADSGGNPVGEALHGATSALGLAEPSGEDFVKRVVGVGGDDVVCCDADGRISVNGVPLEEPYLYPGDAPSKVPFRIAVPPGTLWVMGDHRSQSRDSRDHLGDPGGGMVPVGKVIGRADWIGWPFPRWGATDRGATDRGAASGGGHG
ncbi:signal peptidase I [Streptomyces sp. NPDC051567]|uniref:signal peptidase I n=1 Tax=Streptomyces sp. NPDC051567 TaxID=3365660 RepID=UPI0037B39FBB